MDEPRYHLGSVVHAKGETLEDFDGPLDVILLLLSKNKIEIQDIQISAILEQYLAYLDEMKRMDMEIASEFIAMASYLMYIKTRMLLSKAEQEEAQSEMDKLVESLQKRQRQDAYQQIQKAAKQLAVRNELGLGLLGAVVGFDQLLVQCRGLLMDPGQFLTGLLDGGRVSLGGDAHGGDEGGSGDAGKEESDSVHVYSKRWASLRES